MRGSKKFFGQQVDNHQNFTTKQFAAFAYSKKAPFTKAFSSKFEQILEIQNLFLYNTSNHTATDRFHVIAFENYEFVTFTYFSNNLFFPKGKGQKKFFSLFG